MSVSDKRVIEIIEFYLENGEEKTLDAFDLSNESLHVYKRRYKNKLHPEEYAKKSILRKIADNYSDQELKAIAEGSSDLTLKNKNISFDGKEVNFYVMTDTHFGSIYTNYGNYLAMCRQINNDKDVDFVCHCGDVTEGMSNRQGHVYELTHIGYAKQKELAIDMLNEIKAKKYIISGNHDRWYKSQNGADIVSDICENANDCEFIGHDEGDISINKVKIKLWHGIDASSYAHSYRLQKIIESFTGGKKPHVLLAGHVHKSGYFFDRHIHALSAGCVQSQSKWMRGKRLPSHTGFWKVSMKITKDSIKQFSTTWFPFYD